MVLMMLVRGCVRPFCDNHSLNLPVYLRLFRVGQNTVTHIAWTPPWLERARKRYSRNPRSSFSPSPVCKWSEKACLPSSLPPFPPVLTSVWPAPLSKLPQFLFGNIHLWHLQIFWFPISPLDCHTHGNHQYPCLLFGISQCNNKGIFPSPTHYGRHMWMIPICILPPRRQASFWEVEKYE